MEIIHNIWKNLFFGFKHDTVTYIITEIMWYEFMLVQLYCLTMLAIKIYKIMWEMVFGKDK